MLDRKRGPEDEVGPGWERWFVTSARSPAVAMTTSDHLPPAPPSSPTTATTTASVAKSLPLHVSRFQLIPDRRRKVIVYALRAVCLCVASPSCLGRVIVAFAVTSSRETSSGKAVRGYVKKRKGKKRNRQISPTRVRPWRRILRSRPGTPSRSIMRDMAGKIAELKFEAPLARFEEEDTASLKNMNLLTGAKQTALLFFPFPFFLLLTRCLMWELYSAWCFVCRLLVNLFKSIICARKLSRVYRRPSTRCSNLLSTLIGVKQQYHTL